MRDVFGMEQNKSQRIENQQQDVKIMVNASMRYIQDKYYTPSNIAVKHSRSTSNDDRLIAACAYLLHVNYEMYGEPQLIQHVVQIDKNKMLQHHHRLPS
ncbi:hypothetical protein P8452_52751 [Trifolium repens]|nr:hypothetical protein P8452_52751 [Trifolium repens]